ncbi:hypothetical protein L873DRAFT_1715474 [Choiromyces venosus 120613-1]|uniref:Fungal N-terminal domain-containing protein n=1 Tax=Choiromyces venosus 120613-1 TaxID=1336337 RepID=A0A3N4IY26_9PEZI|nr:hypothetical protein L873DRAFT_1715474 [Choiromyces venosus 120613-1]
MAMPLSIGDILLLSQIAYQVALAFTSGRKSAPKEFNEVENQLFALSKALDMLSEEVKASRANPITASGADKEAAESLGSMITNCRTTLEGLEQIVQEYCPAMDDGKRSGVGGDDAVKLQKRKWSKKIKDNWKKVVWTTGEGDLSVLREKLTLHVTAITLVVGTLQSKKSTRLNEEFGEMRKTLEGIQLDQQQAVKALMEKLPTSTNPIPEIEKLVLHQTGNFINYVPGGSMPNGGVGKEVGSIIPGHDTPPGRELDFRKKGYKNKPVFELCLAAKGGDLKVICARAAVNLEWVPSQRTSVNSKRVRTFVCLCAGTGSSMVPFGASNEMHEIHADELEDLHCLFYITWYWGCRD